MPHPIELLSHLFDLTAKTLCYTLALYGEIPTFPGLRTDMAESKKVKRFRLSFTSLRSVLYRKSAKLNQAGLFGIHFQPKSLHALF